MPTPKKKVVEMPEQLHPTESKQMVIEYRALDTIKPYQFNNKDHTKNIHHIVESIKRYWFRNPILLDAEWVIIAWHGRREASKMLWLSHIPAIVHTDLDEEQVKELRALDNMIGDLADYNLDNLLADFKHSQNTWLTNIIKSQVKGFKLVDDNIKEMQEDLVPVLIRNVVIKKWDIITLGNHRLMCWDSTKAQDVTLLMNGRKADCVRTDPPYNVNYSWSTAKTKDGIKNDNMERSAFRAFLTDAFRAMKDAHKTWAWVYVFHNHKEQATFQEALEANGYSIKQQLIRNKPSLWLWQGDYRPKHELFFYCAVDGQDTTFYGDRTNSTVRDRYKHKTDQETLNAIKKAREAEERGMTSIRSIKRDNTNTYDHPTQKPVLLCQIAIANSSKSWDIILDLFHWSGTLLITAEKTGRQAYAMELDPIYVETAIERRVKYTDEQLIDINGEIHTRDEWKAMWRLSQQ